MMSVFEEYCRRIHETPDASGASLVPLALSHFLDDALCDVLVDRRADVRAVVLTLRLTRGSVPARRRTLRHILERRREMRCEQSRWTSAASAEQFLSGKHVADDACGFEAIQHRHRDVHDDDFRL